MRITPSKPNYIEAQLDALEPEGRPYERRLFSYNQKFEKAEPHFLIFRSLQRLNIVDIQNRLSEFNNAILMDGRAPPTAGQRRQLSGTLRSYATALRDYEYLTQLVPITGSQASKGREILETDFPEYGQVTEDEGAYRRLKDHSRPPEDKLRAILKKFLPRKYTYTSQEKQDHKYEYGAGLPPEELSPLVDHSARFIVAFLGGASLLVPMLVMSLPKVTLTKSLVTTSVAVLLFAVVLSFVFKPGNAETVVGTATYAAVLVVFVGTSS